MIDKEGNVQIGQRINVAQGEEIMKWIARLLLNIDISLQEIRDKIEQDRR